GYDYVTGVGSPYANLVVSALDASTAAPPPPAPSQDHLVLSGPTGALAGTAFSLTVTAQSSSGSTDAGYLGTVQLTSSDSRASLPASYTFTLGDHGTHVFAVTLKTAGGQSMTATDLTGVAGAGTISGITVSPAAANRFALTGLPTNTTPGAALSFTVIADDPYGNVATGYAGTVKFTSSDSVAVLPVN